MCNRRRKSAGGIRNVLDMFIDLSVYGIGCIVEDEQVRYKPPGFVRVVFLCAVHLFSDQKEIDLQSGCN